MGQATNSVVPGATVVSISTRQYGGIFSPMVRMVASSAAISALAGAHVAQVTFGVVALHVDHHTVGQFEAVAVEGGGEGLLLQHTARIIVDFGVLGLDRRFAAVEQGDLPVAARARPLAADDELCCFPFRSWCRRRWPPSPRRRIRHP